MPAAGTEALQGAAIRRYVRQSQCRTPPARLNRRRDQSVLLVPGYRVRHVGFFELGNLVRIELEFDGGHGVIQMMRFGSADNRCGDERLMRDPCQCHLRLRYPACLGHGSDGLDHLAVGVGNRVQRLAEFIGGLAFAAFVPVAV